MIFEKRFTDNIYNWK